MNSILLSETATVADPPAHARVAEESEVHELLVDVSVILRADAHTGIQRVVRSLLRALLDADLSGYVVRPVCATRKTGYVYAPLDAPLFKGRPQVMPTRYGPVHARRGDIFLALDLAANILPQHRRQLARWRRDGCQVATVMYDLLPEHHPRWFNPKTRRNYRAWLRTVTKISDRIVCISHEVADELQRWVVARPWRGHRQLRIDSMRLGSDLEESLPTKGLPADADLILGRLARQRVILVVGTIEPRKGHACLLPAFERLWREPFGEDLVLVFVGRPGWKTERLQEQIRAHPEKARRFLWFDDASDEFLNRLYAVARGVIVASYGEGFGLPLAEAARHDVSILARDLPVFKAMKLANVTYFSDDAPNSLAASIESWLNGSETKTSTGGNAAPRWSDSFADLLTCLAIRERIKSSDE